MTVTLGEARARAQSALEGALPGVPVWPAPPTNVSAPCAILGLGAASAQPTYTRWDAQLWAVLVAPGGDNEAAVMWLEVALLDSARALAAEFISPIVWDEPGTLILGGVSYLTARLRIPIDLEG